MGFNRVYENFVEIEDEVRKSVPPLVYKYRSWESSEHKSLLVDKTSWFAHPFTLNDKQDLRHSYKINIKGYNSIEFYEKLKRLFRINHPDISERELRFYTDRKWIEIQNDPIEYFHKNRETQLNDYDFYKLFGVFSTSINGLSYKVWEEYGDNHKGYCLGFNTVELARLMYCKFGKIAYSDDQMEVNLIDGFTVENQMKEEMLKTTKWDYEEEFRFLTLNIQDENRIKNFTTESVVEIILGYNISQKNEEEIIKIVKEKYNSTIPIYKTIPTSISGKLEKKYIA